MDSCFLPVWRPNPLLWRYCVSGPLLVLQWRNSTFSPQIRAVCVLTGGHSIFIPFAIFTSVGSLLCCQARFFHFFFSFLKGSWPCLNPFGFAGFASMRSISMIIWVFICLASSGFLTWNGGLHQQIMLFYLFIILCQWIQELLAFYGSFFFLHFYFSWEFVLSLWNKKTTYDSEYRDIICS